MTSIVTLDEFIISRQKEVSSASGELSGLLRDIGLAAKIVSREVNKAGLVDVLGQTKNENASGDNVQKLDILADKLLIACLSNSGECCGIASEEQDSFVVIENKAAKNAEYVVLFDPLDGSSNIDSNVSIGTIFAVYERLTDREELVNLGDFLQPGLQQVAAGYVLYGSSTMLVYTTGRGVNGFTLDPSIGEFCLSHPNMKIPVDGNIYSCNQGSYRGFEPAVQAYVEECLDQSMTLRYVGSMVADLHRTLIKGGIFFYPATRKAPKGKLRLLYECNPLAFIVEQAGGKASDGQNRILTIEPTELHQRTPIFIGSKNMVNRVEAVIKEFEAVAVYA